MLAIFYKNNSANDKAIKSLTQLGSSNVVLKNNELITNISLNVVNYYGANYVKLENRFYFINDITRNVNGSFTLQLHIDVLSTYYDILKNKSFRVVRSSNIYNRYIIDNEQTFSSKEQLQTKVFKGTIEITNQLNANDNCFCLTVNNTNLISEVE